MNDSAFGPLPTELQAHPGYRRVFKPGHLTFGFIMPLEGYPSSPFPTLENHVGLAKQADAAGFSALWMRDVPFYDPNFGDSGQMLDPMVYLGFLAAHTRQITLGTAGIVLTLRDPLIVAKQAVSIDQLAQGRLLLGLSTGDRAAEYPAFGMDYDNRAERFREAFELIKIATEQSFPRASTTYYGVVAPCCPISSACCWSAAIRAFWSPPPSRSNGGTKRRKLKRRTSPAPAGCSGAYPRTGRYDHV
tara:strand:- start:3346 stop:4083 length:738 start_codon:yes stop_codon:yes gene_type:complete